MGNAAVGGGVPRPIHRSSTKPFAGPRGIAHRRFASTPPQEIEILVQKFVSTRSIPKVELPLVKVIGKRVK